MVYRWRKKKYKTIKTIKTFKTITIKQTRDNGDLNQYGDRDGEKMDLRGRN